MRLGGIQLTRRGGGELGPQAQVRGKKRGKKRKSEGEGARRGKKRKTEGEKKKKQKKENEGEKRKRKLLHVYDLCMPPLPAWGWVVGGRDERPPKRDTG